jgi:hypothetical protein
MPRTCQVRGNTLLTPLSPPAPCRMLPLEAIGDVIQRDVLNQLRDGPTVLAALKERGLDRPSPYVAPKIPAMNGAPASSSSMQAAILYN